MCRDSGGVSSIEELLTETSSFSNTKLDEINRKIPKALYRENIVYKSFHMDSVNPGLTTLNEVTGKGKVLYAIFTNVSAAYSSMPFMKLEFDGVPLTFKGDSDYLSGYTLSSELFSHKNMSDETYSVLTNNPDSLGIEGPVHEIFRLTNANFPTGDISVRIGITDEMIEFESSFKVSLRNTHSSRTYSGDVYIAYILDE